MSAGSYALGVFLLSIGIGPVIWGAVRVRRRFLPAASGALARLFEAVVALSATTAVAQLLGSIGGFRRVTLIPALAAGGLAMAALGRGSPAVEAGASADEHGTGPRSRAALAVALVAIAIVAGAWTTRTAASVADGTAHFDSLWYHLPHAARFEQTGWVTRLHFTGPDFPETFHPSNAELLHGVGMVAFHRDVLSPFLNAGWVILTLLAAWCVGRRFGAGPLTMTAATLILASPLASVQNAGSASNDVPVMFFLLAAVALLLHRPEHPALRVAAALATGFALSTKLTAAVPAAVLTAGVLVLWRRRGWRRLTLEWVAPLIATGAFWYLRNLVRVGSPIPALSLDAGPLPFSATSFKIVDRFGYSVADYLGDTTVWRRYFFPGLHQDFGRIWWVTFGLATVGAVWAIVNKREPILRVFGVVAIVGAFAYLVMPTTALGPKGQPLLFTSNVTYLTPPLMIALVSLPFLLSSRRPALAWTALGLMTLALVTSQVTSKLGAWGPSFRAYGIVVAVIVVVVGVVMLAVTSVVRRRAPALVVVAVLAAGVVGYPLARTHVRDSFRGDALGGWARSLPSQRIAIAGFQDQFPLYGSHLQNVVQYVGTRGPNGEFTQARDCPAWRAALRRGRFAYVVLKPALPTTDVARREIPWTRSDPAARPLFRAGRAEVFRFDPDVPDPGCPV